jgi:hypothetical protein
MTPGDMTRRGDVVDSDSDALGFNLKFNHDVSARAQADHMMVLGRCDTTSGYTSLHELMMQLSGVSVRVEPRNIMMPVMNQFKRSTLKFVPGPQPPLRPETIRRASCH